MVKKRYSLVCTVLTALVLISHPVWGADSTTDWYTISGEFPYLLLDDTTNNEAGWCVSTDYFLDQAFCISNDTTAHYPFIMERDAPTNSIYIKSDGDVGMGTNTPTYPMEMQKTGINAAFVLNRTDGATNYINATAGFGNFGTVTNHPLRLVANSVWRMRIDTDNSLTMKNGATCTAAGVWTDNSSREAKENIQSLTAEEALAALGELNPVRYNYKVDKEDECVGFIAEEVPDLVATKERKGMSPMDVVAVLTKVVQEQQKVSQEQQKVIMAQQETIAELNRRVVELEAK